MPTEWIEEVADLFKALSEPTRLLLLREVREQERTVSELAALSGTSLANVSKHLAYMKRVGLVARRKSGSQVFYALRDQEALEMVDTIRSRLRGSPVPLPEGAAQRSIDPPGPPAGSGVRPTRGARPSGAPSPNDPSAVRRAGQPSLPVSGTGAEVRQPRLDGLDSA